MVPKILSAFKSCAEGFNFVSNIILQTEFLLVLMTVGWRGFKGKLLLSSFMIWTESRLNLKKTKLELSSEIFSTVYLHVVYRTCVNMLIVHSWFICICMFCGIIGLLKSVWTQSDDILRYLCLGSRSMRLCCWLDTSESCNWLGESIHVYVLLNVICLGMWTCCEVFLKSKKTETFELAVERDQAVCHDLETLLQLFILS